MIILIPIAILILITIFFMFKTVYPKTWSTEDSYKNEIETGQIDPAMYEALDKEKVVLNSIHGYALHGYFFDKGQDKTIVLAHGHTYTMYGSIKYMDMFVEKGFNVFVYDHRYHGESGGKSSTFGFYEKDDLKTCIDWISDRFGEGHLIGTHGESMGGSTVLLHAAIDLRIKFVIADCPYAHINEVFKHQLKTNYRIRGYVILPMLGFFNWILHRFTFGQCAPINTIEEIHVPVLLIHGESDTFTPVEHSRWLEKKGHDITALYIEGAEHARSVVEAPEKYRAVVHGFLEKHAIV